MLISRHILNLFLVLAAITKISASGYTTKSIYVSPGIVVAISKDTDEEL